MSLTSILKQIDKVDQKQQLVYKRFNYKNNNKKHSQLIQQEKEDKKIFGYSHSDILQKINKNNKSQLQMTRPSTAVETKPVQFKKSMSSHHKKEMKRAQSAVKLQLGNKNQFNFLFKEDIFDNNHRKLSRANTAKFSQYRSQNKAISQKFHKITQKTKENSKENQVNTQNRYLKKQTIHFMKTFDVNNYKYVSSTTNNGLKKYSNAVICQRKLQKKPFLRKTIYQQNQKDVNIFDLTKVNQIKQTKDKNNIFTLNSSLNLIHKINKHLSSNTQQKYLNCKRQSIYNQSYSIFQSNIKNLLPDQFIITIIQIETLNIIDINIIKKKQFFINQKTLEHINLTNIIKDILKIHNYIHVYIHNTSKLLHEQFISNKSLSYKHSKQNQIKILHYYLKRFLLLDSKTSIQSSIQNSNLILNCIFIIIQVMSIFHSHLFNFYKNLEINHAVYMIKIVDYIQ